MSDHEMINLDEMGSLKTSMESLQETLLNNHRIDPNLYIEYDVKRGLRDSAGNLRTAVLWSITIRTRKETSSCFTTV